MANSLKLQQDLSIEAKIKSSESITIGYRKDIDGLRAVAVLLVVLYHIFGSIFPGGFIGVDIFFVISGYLISTHIITELEDGKFSLKEFYNRRIRRILPAFIFVLLIVNVIGFFVLLSPDLKKLSQASFSAMLSFSNIYFWKVVLVGYFQTDATILPLLHTWSLGVEEQFYFIWPIILIILFHAIGNQGIDKDKKRVLLGGITLFMAVVSFFLYYHFRAHLSMVFYAHFTRAFELLIGASLAIYWTRLKTPSFIFSIFLSTLSFLLVFYSTSHLTPKNYPSVFILFPCFAAALLIYSGKNDRNIINKILSLKLMTFLGLISYSLYLWHWPIVAYINYLGISIDSKVGLNIFLSSIILAFFTWKYIEQPFRKKYKFCFKKTILLFLIIPIFLVGGFALIFFALPNFGFDQDPKIARTIADYYGPYEKAYCIDSKSPLRPSSPKTCSIGDLSKEKISVLVVGDSHAMHLTGLLNVFLNKAHLKAYVVTQSGTPYIIGKIKDWRANMPMKRNAILKKMITENHYPYVVLGGYWNSYHDKTIKGNSYNEHSYKVFEHGLKIAIETVLNSGSIPVLVYDVPPLFKVPLNCGFTRLKLTKCYNPSSVIDKAQAQIHNIFLNIMEKYPSVRFIDLSSIICQNQRCLSAINDTPIYNTNGDNSHLNYTGSILIGQIYSDKYTNPFI